MAGLISQYQQGAFTSPVNATVADATVVLSNDNATRGKHNSHDGDATIHVQSSTLASRPSAATAQRFWVTTDGLRAYLDTGSAWSELAYLPLAVGGSVGGNITITSGGLTVSSGTSALQAATVTTLTASAALSLSVSAADAILVVQGGATSAAYTQYKRGSTSQWAVGTSITSGGIFQIYNNVLGAVAFSVDPSASAATFANSVTIAAGGLTVSSGTSAFQAVTADTVKVTGSGGSFALGVVASTATIRFGWDLAGAYSLFGSSGGTHAGLYTGLIVADGLISGSAGLTVSSGTTAVQALTATTVTGTGLFLTPASATGSAGLRLPHGAAPTSPTDGDMWTTTAGLFVRINGVTKTVTLT